MATKFLNIISNFSIILLLVSSNVKATTINGLELKEIIEEWANLKVEAFENRRSWVRATPSK